MDVKKRQARRMLDKLHFVCKGRKEIQYYFYHNGKLLFTTAIPKGEGDIHKHTQNEIRSQMLLCLEQFQQAYNCPMRYEEYFEKLEEKGIIPSK